VYSTLRPTSSYFRNVHLHIKVPYLLMTDTADVSITHSREVNAMLAPSSMLQVITNY
tara:strand:+ start:290 stop:460 length:171 start_codon:yes stop_codon:yes gene_type:complete